MDPTGKCWGKVLVIGLSFVVSLSVAGQIATDGTVGPAVSLDGLDVTVAQDLGARRGDNLFHSFQTFNIQTGGSATFTGANDIANVISRVTGGEVSTIDGTLRSEIGQADFFIINPAGVVFGPGAQVDVPASFHVSTAEELRFSDGAVYNAVNPETSTLTMATPEAYGFLGQRRGAVIVDQAELSFQPESTVSIVAGDFTLQGGEVISRGSGINIVAQGDTAETVPINGEAPATATGDFTVTSSPTQVSSDGSVVKGGKIFADNDSAGKIKIVAGNIKIEHDGEISISTFSQGNPGSIEVTAKNLEIVGGGKISASNDSFGNSGSVTLKTGWLLIDGTGSSIESKAGEFDSGTIEVTADNVVIRNGGTISTQNTAQGVVENGNAGTVRLTVEDRLLIDNKGLIDNTGFMAARTGITSTAFEGNAGTIDITASILEIFNGGTVLSSTFGTGSAGSVMVRAHNRVVIDNNSVEGFFLNDGIVSQSGDFASDGSLGLPGTVEIVTGDLEIRDGGRISIANLSFQPAEVLQSAERGGPLLRIVADTLLLTGGSSITSQAFGNDAGPIEITVHQHLILNASSRITTEVSNLDRNGRNIPVEQRPEATAGPITVNGDMLILRDSQITTATNSESGNGGDITLAPEVLVLEGGFIQANAVSGQGGNISINTDVFLADTGTVLIGGGERLSFQPGGPNVIQAVAPPE